jgi:hypothetical protein
MSAVYLTLIILLKNSSNCSVVSVPCVVGTNVFFIDNFLEFYVQAAWQPILSIVPDFGFGWKSFPINAGFRFWF